MAKTRQILKLAESGMKFSVVYRENEENPYVVYRHTWGLRKDGYGYCEHKRIETRYADMRSCLFFLARLY